MSLKFAVLSPRFLLNFCAVLCLTLFSALPQEAAASTTGIGKGVPQYSAAGIDVRVTPAGGIPGQIGESACPFVDRDMGKINAAFEASRAKGDPDGCPFAEDNVTKKRVYFRSCRGIYHELARTAATVESPEPNMALIGCHLEPGERRERYRSRESSRIASYRNTSGSLYKSLKIVPESAGVLSTEDIQKINDLRMKEREANLQCFDDSLNRISEYWAKQRGVSCVRYIQGIIKRLVKGEIRSLKDAMLEKTATGLSNAGPIGAATVIMSPPSIGGGVSIFAAVANFAYEVITVANDASDLLNTLSEECGNVIPQIKELQEWRKGALGGVCRAAMNLVERQLTQCIRVNIGASAALRLPQFNVALQCPVSINFQARLTPRGFDCFGGVSAGSPVVASTGRRSLLGGNGGLENLFEGKCFTSPTSRASGTLPGVTDTSSSATTGTPSDQRNPGIDCGPLDTNPNKRIEIQGMKVLTQNRVENGWAVGGSETVNGQEITRCDFYNAGSLVRTTYVYGNGSSCSNSTGGFLSGGYETNIACYPGGYTPATAPNIPDACMYPIECLDAAGKFDASRSGACATAKPLFDASRTYNTFIGGGIGAASVVGRSCSDFSAPGDVKKLLCCDPQKQDCRKKDADTPICACDEGDANNKVKIDLLSGVADASGMCEQGGRKTCCSPRLNGGKEMCASMGMPICDDGLTDMCVDSTVLGVYKGPDGVERREVELSGGRVEKFSVAHAIQSKPSPYLYLFVRPDVTLATGQQCCTTEWCNVCPQHYVNAYGLSLIRDDHYSNPKNDAHNNSIVGKGWPFKLVDTGDDDDKDKSTYSLSDDSYLVGVSKVGTLSLYIGKEGKEKELPFYAAYAPLHMSDMVKKPANLDLCNRTTKLEASFKPMQNFTGGESMGMTWNKERKKKRSPRFGTLAGVPMPMEYPIDYLNSQRRSVKDADGTPLPPIQLCSELEICLPPESGTVLNLDAKSVSKTMPTLSLGSGILDSRRGLPTVIPSVTTPLTPSTPVPGTPMPSGGIPVTPVTPTVPGVYVPTVPAAPGAGPTPVPPAGPGTGLAPASPIGLF